MDNRIVIKTDAAFQPEGGIGMGYSATFNDDEYTGRGYIEKKTTSTKAEMLSTAWGIHDFSNQLNIDFSNYTLVVKTDCENTVNKYDSDYESNEMRFINHYSDKYKRLMMFWIPRETNTKADSIAKTMLERGKRK